MDRSAKTSVPDVSRRHWLRVLATPFLRIRARWRHEWSWGIRRGLFEIRHYRRLSTMVGLLLVAGAAWVVLVIGLAGAIGRPDLLRGTAFLQNVFASLLVLPIGVAVAVIAGTMLEKHALRFKARRAADELANCVSLAVFTFVLVLERECNVPINIAGPTDHKFAARALDVTVKTFAGDSYKTPLPANFGHQLETTVASMADCFRRSADLHLAFPRAFDLMFDLEKLMKSIKTDPRSSGPHNTTFIILNFAIRILRDLQ